MVSKFQLLEFRKSLEVFMGSSVDHNMFSNHSSNIEHRSLAPESLFEIQILWFINNFKFCISTSQSIFLMILMSTHHTSHIMHHASSVCVVVALNSIVSHCVSENLN